MRIKDIFTAAILFGGIGGYAWSNLPPSASQASEALQAPETVQSPEEIRQVEQSIYYSGCNEVRAAGKAPLYIGDPGYREGMDGDGDGIACEPYRGRI